MKGQSWKIYIPEHYKEKIMVLKMQLVFVLVWMYVSYFLFKFKLFFFFLKMRKALKFELSSEFMWSSFTLKM